MISGVGEEEPLQNSTSTGWLTIPRPSVSDMTKAVATQDVMLSGTVTGKLLSVEPLRTHMWKRLSQINSHILKIAIVLIHHSTQT